MYEAGHRVVYGSHGVCRVTAQEVRKIDRKNVSYLVLEPEGQSGASFLVPTHNDAAMAKLSAVLTEEALLALLDSNEVREPMWVEDGNRRRLQFREILNSGNRVRLLQMICALYRFLDQREAQGKKLHQSDDGYLRDAERLICSEIRYVLGMDLQQARTFLREKLQA